MRRGFSLVELLTALSVFAIIAAMILPRYLDVRRETVLVQLEANLKSINKTYHNWLSLGGQRNGASPTQLLQFLNTDGAALSTTRVTGNPARDNPNHSGSWFLSLSAPVNTTPPAVEGFNDLGDADGLFFNSFENERFRIQIDANSYWYCPDL